MDPLQATQNSLPRTRGLRHPGMDPGEESFSDRELGAFHAHGMPPLGKHVCFDKLALIRDLCCRETNVPEITKDIERPGPARLAHQAMASRFPPPDPRVRPMLPPDRPITARGYHPPHHPPPGHPGVPPGHPRSKMPPQMEDFYARGGRPPRPGRPTEVRHRLFVALFDYDPQSMSPNPDACEEELPFREGQTIKVGVVSISLLFAFSVLLLMHR